MANCSFHADRESEAKCKICGKDLCGECNNIQNRFGACPNCSKAYLKRLYNSNKQGFWYNMLSVVCAVSFLALYLVQFFTGKLSLTFKVVGGVIIALLLTATIVMLVYR